MHSHRHAGPKSIKYNELEKMINQYYEMLQRKRHEHANRFAVNIRKEILLNGCPEDDIIAETSTPNPAGASGANQSAQMKVPQPNDAAGMASGRRLLSKIGGSLPTMRRVEDTLRGKLWRLLLGVSNLDANDYKNQIKKKEMAHYYVKIRGDTKRTFLTSEEYNSRVSEERLVRVLNSFVHRYSKPYCQGMDAIAAGLLYVMPELDAFASFSLLINSHFPTYFYSDQTRKKDLIGAYAGSFLAWDILKICDREIFNHLKALPPHTYFFPLVASFQAISQPFTALQRLWDFLFCFGVHLNPVLATAQILVNKKLLLKQSPPHLLQGLLSQRKWMNYRLDARAVVDCAMHLIILLRDSKHAKLWDNIARHSSDFEVAIQIKVEHETGVSYKAITTAHLPEPATTTTSTSTTTTTHMHNGHGNGAMNGNGSKHVPEVDMDEVNDDDGETANDAARNSEDDEDPPPQYKRYKTQSEENFGNLQGAHSLRKLSPDHDDGFSPESDAEIDDDEKDNE